VLDVIAGLLIEMRDVIDFPREQCDWIAPVGGIDPLQAPLLPLRGSSLCVWESLLTCKAYPWAYWRGCRAKVQIDESMAGQGSVTLPKCACRNMSGVENRGRYATIC
jgi:hypothetical protein